MDQLAGNGLPDPYSDATDQPVLPWRGRITSAKAPGQAGSPDGTALAEAEVADFFGTSNAADFTVTPGNVTYSGPQDWRYRRFILHQAALCAAAGGVDAFCIGSEMRGLTQIRGTGNSFPAVAALIALAAEVRSILGPDTKITYAADWSEYFGYITPQGDRFFHLDPLWADANIDAVAIDNYMPLSDWRDGTDHADAAWGSIYDLDYLTTNVAGGEGYDWFYASDLDRDQQRRTPIRDESDWGEDWIWRYKDIRGWWENDHHETACGWGAMQRKKTAVGPAALSNSPILGYRILRSCPGTSTGTATIPAQSCFSEPANLFRNIQRALYSQPRAGADDTHPELSCYHQRSSARYTGTPSPTTSTLASTARSGI